MFCLQATVRCLADNGRLLEIGKYDILKGTPLSMRPMLRNCAFEGIDLDRIVNDPSNITEVPTLADVACQDGRSPNLPHGNTSCLTESMLVSGNSVLSYMIGGLWWKDLFVLSAFCSLQAWEVHALLAAGIVSGEVVPLPLNRFARKDAGNAFRFMAAGTAPPQSMCNYAKHKQADYMHRLLM